MITKICSECDGKFINKNKRTLTCSPLCSQRRVYRRRMERYHSDDEFRMRLNKATMNSQQKKRAANPKFSELRACGICGNEFEAIRRNARYCSNECRKIAHYSHQLERNRANPGKVALQVRLRKYGLTLEQYHALWERAEGACEMCSTPFPQDPVSFEVRIDHDHNTGKVRGLLCHRCNVGLHYIEDEQFVRNAARYLQGDF